MLVLGIDPSLSRTGAVLYILEHDKISNITLMDIKNPITDKKQNRLTLYEPITSSVKAIEMTEAIVNKIDYHLSKLPLRKEKLLVAHEIPFFDFRTKQTSKDLMILNGMLLERLELRLINYYYDRKIAVSEYYSMNPSAIKSFLNTSEMTKSQSAKVMKAAFQFQKLHHDTSDALIQTLVLLTRLGYLTDEVVTTLPEQIREYVKVYKKKRVNPMRLLWRISV